MLKKLINFTSSRSFMYLMGGVFMFTSLFEHGVQAGVTLLTGVIICGIERIIQELEFLNSKK